MVKTDERSSRQHARWINWEMASWCSIALWLAVQVVLIAVYWNVEQRSDQGGYLQRALNYYNEKSWYPDMREEYSFYIFAPGLVNFFILQLKVFGTLKINYLINLILNTGILINVWYLAKRFFSQRTAQIAVTMFCLMYSNMMVVLPAGTEIPFLFLALSAFTLCLSNKTVWKLALAGIMLALANWVRPLTIIYMPAILLYMYFNKSRVVHYVALLLPIALVIVLIGLATQNRTGHFVYQSTTSGVNLIMSHNDKAYGGVATSLHNDTTSTVYIRDIRQYSFLQRDSIWKARAIEWIKEHPAKTMGLYIAKIAGLYVEDSWPERPILGGDGFVDKAAHGHADKMAIVHRVWNMFYKSLVYYIVLSLSVIAMIRYRRKLFSDKGYVLLIWLFGTLVTCVVSVSPRYHYPLLFPLILWAAYGIDRYLLERRGKKCGT